MVTSTMKRRIDRLESGNGMTEDFVKAIEYVAVEPLLAKTGMRPGKRTVVGTQVFGGGYLERSKYPDTEAYKRAVEEEHKRVCNA